MSVLPLTDQAATDWFRRAACKGLDPNLFFPARGESTVEAKRVCAGCDVRAECLAEALATGERFGIRGGLSDGERRTLRAGVPVVVRSVCVECAARFESRIRSAMYCSKACRNRAYLRRKVS